ncbi:hypothetical protein L3X38_028013 [Prunus dulcis]|uniref:Integrase catalytic domain-containing protein n=1 Tax=Prunus dulcis TaxID=3755 RepID=A0AAD4VPW1_PRUDU|nr:hypothetical protein L3X38_028013 [Prunus dulcis]
MRVNYTLNKQAKIFIDEIVRLHGVLVSIIPDRDPRFTSRFWTNLNEAFGTQLRFSTAFHPKTDGQSERTIQTLEDMLRACVLQFRGDWDEKLPLMELAYNNNYQASIGMSPFDALYGRQCKTPLYWDEVGEHRLEVFEDVERTKKQYISDPSHVLEEQPIELKDDLSYVEQPVQILDWKTQVLRSREIPLVKVLWRSHNVEEATWEPEDQMRDQYPYLFE